MEFINKLRLTIEGMGKRDFYKYLFIILGVIVLLAGFVVFRYYRKINDLNDQIAFVNATREEEVRTILRRMDDVEQQRKKVNDVLDKDKKFKIAGYFKQLIEQQGLSTNKTKETSTTVTLPNGYQEVSLSTGFIGLTMKQLTELLDALEKNERVYAKNLEITKSKRMPKKIDVNVTIATLEPKLKAGR